jgi:hypothetical protein
MFLAYRNFFWVAGGQNHAYFRPPKIGGAVIELNNHGHRQFLTFEWFILDEAILDSLGNFYKYKISKFGGKCPLPILGRFYGAVKIFKKIGKIHQYSYFGTIYSKKRKPRSIEGIIIRQVYYKKFQKINFFSFLSRLQSVEMSWFWIYWLLFIFNLFCCCGLQSFYWQFGEVAFSTLRFPACVGWFKEH